MLLLVIPWKSTGFSLNWFRFYSCKLRKWLICMWYWLFCASMWQERRKRKTRSLKRKKLILSRIQRRKKHPRSPDTDTDCWGRSSLWVMGSLEKKRRWWNQKTKKKGGSAEIEGKVHNPHDFFWHKKYFCKRNPELVRMEISTFVILKSLYNLPCVWNLAFPYLCLINSFIWNVKYECSSLRLLYPPNWINPVES